MFSEISNKLKNYKLVIVGSGSGKKKLTKKIEHLNMKKRVILKPWSKNLSNEFNSSKIFILPSLYEGCPNILIEAVANKIPCISSNCSGALDILKNNKAGFIYSINDKKKIKNFIFKISKNYNYFQKEALRFSKTQKRFCIDNQSKKYIKYLMG